jgi:hypothetical protein
MRLVMAGLCVATSADKDVVASLKKLYDPKNPPVNLPKYMDAQNVLVHYLFIHDLSSGVSQQESVYSPLLHATFLLLTFQIRVYRIHQRSSQVCSNTKGIQGWHVPYDDNQLLTTSGGKPRV